LIKIIIGLGFLIQSRGQLEKIKHFLIYEPFAVNI